MLLKDKEFQRHFGVRDRFCDPLLSILAGEYVIDIIKFDEWLHDVHGYDEDLHGSMKDFIHMKWGEEADAFISRLCEAPFETSE